MKKLKKIIIPLVLVILTVSGISVSAYTRIDKTALEIFNIKRETFKESEVAEAHLKANSNHEIVATVNGTPILSSEVELLRFSNTKLREEKEMIYSDDSEKLAEELEKYPVDDKSLIENLARRIIKLEDAKNFGVNITRDDAITYLKEWSADIAERAAKGEEPAIYKMKRDAEYFEDLGMTQDEYINTIGADAVYDVLVQKEYVEAYYAEQTENMKNGGEFILLDERIDDLMDKAEIKIIDDLIEVDK